MVVMKESPINGLYYQLLESVVIGQRLRSLFNFLRCYRGGVDGSDPRYTHCSRLWDSSSASVVCSWFVISATTLKSGLSLCISVCLSFLENRSSVVSLDFVMIDLHLISYGSRAEFWICVDFLIAFLVWTWYQIDGLNYRGLRINVITQFENDGMILVTW